MKISQTVFELQSGHDFVTYRRTDDQGKNNTSPNPTGGGHNEHAQLMFANLINSILKVGLLVKSLLLVLEQSAKNDTYYRRRAG